MTCAGAAFIYRGRKWAVWANGHMASIGGGLCIQCDTLADKACLSGSGAVYYTWPVMISREPGIDLDDFMGAFMYALGKFHPDASLELAIRGWVIAIQNRIAPIECEMAEVLRRYEKGEFVLGRGYREPSVDVMGRAPADNAEIDASAKTKPWTMPARNPGCSVPKGAIGLSKADMYDFHGTTRESVVRPRA